MVIMLNQRAVAPIKLGTSNFILHDTGFRHEWTGVGALSLKFFVQGEALYEVGKGRFLVDEGSFLVLNHRQPYAITLPTKQKTESFCLFFAEGFAEEVYRSLATQTPRLLEEPVLEHASVLNFFERTYAHHKLFVPLLASLHEAIAQKKYERLWLEERFHLVMQRLLHVQREAYREAEALPAVRAATREELYRRLHRAGDYMRALRQEPLSLAELAQVACLSPNHFLRSFRRLFGQTPHQYLTALRLEQARVWLLRTERSITDICFGLGFESAASFSLLFAKHHGMSPSKYRGQKGDFR